MKQRMICLLLVLALACSLMPAAAAASPAVRAANALYTMGLFDGVGQHSDGSPIYALDRSLTRQEMAQTLFLYVKKCGVSTSQRADLSGYADEGDVADWARTAMEWAVAEGILAGRTVGGKTVLDPAGSVTRAEFSAVLQTLCEDVLV